MTNVVRFPSEIVFSQYRIDYQDKKLPSLLLEVASYLRDRAENNPSWEPERIYWLFKTLRSVAYTADMQKLADDYIAYAEKLLSEKGGANEPDEE
jgi:hypothetical protein